MAAGAPALCRQAWRQLPRATVAPLLLQQRQQQQRATFSAWARGSNATAAAAAARAWTIRSIKTTATTVRTPLGQRPYSSATPPPERPTTVKFWPFFAVFGLSFVAFMFVVEQRKGMPAIETATNKAGQQQQNQRLPAPAKSTPTFSADDVTVIFVLGGPGAGKGTQCARLVDEYGFAHLSAGDLLRAEQERPGSEFGEIIKDCIRNGAIVPMEVTVQLLENAMTEVIDKAKAEGSTTKAKFLIDGFPRKMDQAFKFEEAVCPARFVLFYDCPEAEMESRLLERGKTSGRADDNAESIRKRFRTFVETSMPVVNHYEKEGRVIKIDATPSPDLVHKHTCEELARRLGTDL